MRKVENCRSKRRDQASPARWASHLGQFLGGGGNNSDTSTFPSAYPCTEGEHVAWLTGFGI